MKRIQLAPKIEEITYDCLEVAPILVYDNTMVKGLSECIDKRVVCSNYTDPNCTWDVIKSFKRGTALLLSPPHR